MITKCSFSMNKLVKRKDLSIGSNTPNGPNYGCIPGFSRFFLIFLNTVQNIRMKIGVLEESFVAIPNMCLLFTSEHIIST